MFSWVLNLIERMSAFVAFMRYGLAPGEDWLAVSIYDLEKVNKNCDYASSPVVLGKDNHEHQVFMNKMKINMPFDRNVQWQLMGTLQYAPDSSGAVLICRVQRAEEMPTYEDRKLFFVRIVSSDELQEAKNFLIKESFRTKGRLRNRVMDSYESQQDA